MQFHCFFVLGEKSLQFSSEKLVIEILINPQLRVLSNRIKHFFIDGGCYHHLIYSGIVVQNSGSWVLQDSLYNLSNFADLFRSAEVVNAVKQNVLKDHVIFSLNAETEWTETQLSKLSSSLNFCLNPLPLDDADVYQDFLKLLSQHVKVTSVTNLLRASNVVGNIRFTRPTLYIFPGCQGDSSLFGISGFNLLINAGYSRKSAFWDFTRHLDRIDAMIMSHLGPDNFFGISSVVSRKMEETLHPEIGCMFLNAIADLSKIIYTDKEPGLMLNMMSESTKLVDKMKQIGLGARPCLGSVVNGALQSFNLYHKVGHGSLDLFVLNPMHDSKHLKEFLIAWNKGASAFTSKTGLPLCNASSVCALLVWRPSSFTESITRLLFPGSVPQDILFEGLDHVKGMNLFKHAQCCEKDLVISKVTSTRKTLAKPVTPRPTKSLTVGTVINSPKSEISSPKSDLSLKDKKSNWPIKKESGSLLDMKKDKKTSETQKLGEKFIADEETKESKVSPSEKPNDEGFKDASLPSVAITPEKHEANVDSAAQELPTEPLISLQPEPESAKHDSLENLKELKISEDNKEVSENKDFFDKKALQEGLQEETNPFLGIDGKKESENNGDPGNLEVPMALPPPIKISSKQSTNSSTSPRKSIPASFHFGDKKMSSDSDKPKSTLHKKMDTKYSRDNKKSLSSRGSQKVLNPVYVDLTYVPNHGDPKYVDVDFFRRVRARYYVFSTISPDAGVLTALMEAKQTWEEPDLEITIIPTYDTEVLRYWLAAHHDQLSQLKINVAPAANRCTIQLQDHETSCAAFRLEF